METSAGLIKKKALNVNTKRRIFFLMPYLRPCLYEKIIKIMKEK